MLFKSLICVTLDKPSHNMLGWVTFLDEHPLLYKECKCVINLLLNTYRCGSKLCPLCNAISCDSIEHILFECSSGKAIRNELWQKVLNSCPNAMVTELNKMSYNSKVLYIYKVQ